MSSTVETLVEHSQNLGRAQSKHRSRAVETKAEGSRNIPFLVTPPETIRRWVKYILDFFFCRDIPIFVRENRNISMRVRSNKPFRIVVGHNQENRKLSNFGRKIRNISEQGRTNSNT